MSEDTTELLCSQYSQAAGEDLIATVAPASHWLLLEYNGRWGRDALEEADLLPPVREHVFGALAALEGRALALRQKPRLELEGNLNCFVGVAREYEPALYQFRLERYEDLLALDLEAIVRGDSGYDAYRRSAPLYLVCTHGRRDRCCARSGVPLYTQLVASAGAQVWQTSHVGGHRFAANLVCFPHGLFYGRVSVDDAEPIRAAYEQGDIVLDRFRGRACYPKPAQAAELLLRLETGMTAVDAYQLARIEQTEPDHYAVHFASRRAVDSHVIHLREEIGALRILESCDAEMPSEVSQWRLVRHEVITAVGD